VETLHLFHFVDDFKFLLFQWHQDLLFATQWFLTQLSSRVYSSLNTQTYHRKQFLKVSWLH
jgi:hypothetical protein